MKRVAWLVSVVVALAAVWGGMAEEVPSLNVIGFMELPISGGAADTYTLLAVPMTKVPAARGTITSNTTNSIVDSGASWTNSQWHAGIEGRETYGETTYFIEVISTNSGFEGRHFYISDNVGNTLALASPIAGGVDLAGESYKIVAANRVRDIFGNPEDGTVRLMGAASATDADTVLLWDEDDGWNTTVYFKSSGLGQTNVWMIGSTPSADVPIDRDEGFFVKRFAGGSATNLVVSGEVSGNPQAVVMEPGSIGYTLVGGMVASDSVLSNTTLQTILKGAASPDDADNILYWDEATTNWSTPIYFKNSGLGQTNVWMQASTPVGDYVLRAGKGYFFKVSTNNTWFRESPL